MKTFLKGLVYVRFARTLSFLSMTEAQILPRNPTSNKDK